MLRERPDLVAVLEAAYADRDDEKAWAEDLVRSTQHLFPRATGVGLHIIEHDADFTHLEIHRPVAFGGAQGLAAVTSEVASLVGPNTSRRYYSPDRLATTHSEIDMTVDARSRELLAKYRKAAGFTDALGLKGEAEPGLKFVVYMTFDERVSIERAEREHLSRVALHLESAVRLRYRPETMRAVISPDGVVHHLTDGALRASELEQRVALIESARKKSARNDPASIAVWEALLEGRVSLVERTISGKRYYLLVDNPPARCGVRELTQREVGVVRMAARGLPSKLLSYGLGLSPQTISRTLSSAANKIGLSSSLQLVRIAAHFSSSPSNELDANALTSVEREILELIRQGLSNSEIARARGRSARTVANQVASILRKTHSPTRRALVASNSAQARKGPA
ncbi:hypothetical protein AKJ09_05849 [Labilithrix luteola]|uniref:HTH luxR-type domain-containing protein n=1 Tax=Labilithrix luteola TaxID=1391654 RepID=A0A0K1Q076_9BACT|nr:LuxR C-terminal-related transcriptional regulator [Labilithrix luteola]AKU99185.1 hypothetical protein AKJ09_05849 [Labilithrix luteola]